MQNEMSLPPQASKKEAENASKESMKRKWLQITQKHKHKGNITSELTAILRKEEKV